jgi:bifunctional non-homologous end joining protein LigD
VSGRTTSEVSVGSRTLTLSNLDKVFYPKTGFTKADVIDYYARVAPVLLPHLKDRPLTMKRYPNGVEGMYFYEKRCPAHRPEWVQTHAIWSEGNEADIDFCLANDLPTLVWAANLANLELHTYLHLARGPSHEVLRPTMVMFDLDPGPPAGIVLCSRIASRLREIFDALGLQSFAKTSGSKGMQVCVPLNTETDYASTKTFARSIAEFLERERPDEVVSSMAKSVRTGRVFVDWSQNDPHKTTVCVYSLRAKDEPTVSTPVTWNEVAASAASRDPAPLVFTAPDVLARVTRHGDLFAPVQTLRQKLPFTT